LKIPNPSPHNYTPVSYPSPRNYTLIPHPSPRNYTPVSHSSPHDYTLTPPSTEPNFGDSTEPDFGDLTDPPCDPYVDLLDFSNQRRIASGQVVASATTGTVVHGHQLLIFERKVYVSSVEPGEENNLFYHRSHGVDTIKDVEKSWVV